MVAPFLVIFALGGIDVGQRVNFNQLVNNAPREGARAATRADVQDVAELEAAVQQYLQDSLSNVEGASLSAAVSFSTSDDDGTLSGGDLTRVESGGPVTVTFDYESVSGKGANTEFHVVVWAAYTVVDSHFKGSKKSQVTLHQSHLFDGPLKPNPDHSVKTGFMNGDFTSPA